MKKLTSKFRALFGDQLPEETTDEQIDEFMTEFATFAKPPMDEEEEEGEDEEDEDEPMPPPKKKPKKNPAAMDDDRERRTATDRRLEAQQQEIAELRQANLKAQIKADAVAFADGEIKSKRAIDSRKDELVDEYIIAALDDAQIARTVTFADDKGKVKQGSRVDALKARHAKNPPHGLYREYIGRDELPVGSMVLMNQDEAATRGEKAPTQDRINSLLAMTDLGQAALAHNRANGKS